MRKSTLLALSSVSFSALLLSATPAFGQAATPVTPGGSACQAPAESVDKVKCPDTTTTTTTVAQVGPTAAQPSDGENITVVGSRIRRNSYNTGENITVLTRAETLQAGFNSTTEALQSTSVTSGSGQINNTFGGFVTDGGPGANTISLRGLGATRTLLLLNGRRIAPAGTRGSVGSADLNVLPTAVIDRIEILKAGASSVYGSDAVAGVVNVVTRTKIKGIELEAQQNLPELGAGGSRRISLLGGWANDRFQVSGALEYYEREPLNVGDVPFFRCPTDYLLTATDRTPGAGDFIDPTTGKSKCFALNSGGVTINTIGTNTRNGVGAPGSVSPGTISRFNRFRPNASVTTGLPGFEGVGGGRNSLNVRDTFSPDFFNNSLVSPAKTYNGFLQSSFQTDALGHAEIYGELVASRRESSQVSFRQLSLDYLKGSPLIPAGLQSSTFSGPTATSSGQKVGVRAFIGFGNTSNSQKVDFVRANGGLRGDFILPNFKYNAFVGQSWSDASYTSQTFLTDRITKSTDVVTLADGSFACRDASGGCVAAPVLTPAVIGGQLPDAYRNYILQNVVGTTKYRETTFAFDINGPLFRLPGGSAQGVIGTEYRKAQIDDTPPIDSQNGNLFNLTSATPTRGKDSVYETYAEVELPFLRRVPGAYELTVNASGRYTHYKSYGSGKTYKVGAEYAPVRWLAFRGNYGTSFRAPALFEQFLGATSGFLSSNGDPCNNFGAPDVSPILAKNCASEGLAPDFTATSGIKVLTAGGAASGLKSEKSKSWSIGGVFQPSFGSFGNLSLAVDYFRTDVRNGVSRAGAGNILGLCYNDPQFRAGGGFCNLVTRQTGTNILTVNNNYVNLSQDIVRGLDFNGRYDVKIGGGKFVVDAQVTRFLNQQTRIFATDPLEEDNGTIGQPKWSGAFSANFNINHFNFHYGLEWVGRTDSYALQQEDPLTSRFILKTKDYFLHSASIQWKGKAFGMTVGVRNLLNKQPPQISSGGGYSRVGNAPLYSGYDYAGRTFFVNVSASLSKLGSHLGL